MQKLLTLSDRALVRSLYDLEKYGGDENDAFGGFRECRSHLSRLAWNSFAQALVCDSGIIAKTGLHVSPMDNGSAGRFASILERSPEMTLRREDFAVGYMATIEPHILGLLNGTNDYREVTTELSEMLRVFLTQI